MRRRIRRCSGGGFLLPFGKHLALEVVEVPGLAEEMSLVGGDAVDHHRPLVLLVGLGHQLVVLLHIAQAEKPQPAGEPAGQQGVLVGCEPNTRLLVNQLLILGE